MPFGGYKESGWGREMGPNALESYLETKSVVTQLAQLGDRANRGGPHAEVREGANTQRAPPAVRPQE